jgi:homoserine kinase
VPGKLGMALVEGYDSMGIAMSKPNYRQVSTVESRFSLTVQRPGQLTSILALHGFLCAKG